MIRYLHEEFPELSAGFFQKGNIQVGPGNEMDLSAALNVAVVALKIAVRLGVKPPAEARPATLPYGDSTLLFDAPLISAMVNKKIGLLRGWKEFGSCIKGFNFLGLMAEIVIRETRVLNAMSLESANEIKKDFLKTRNINGKLIFSQAEIYALSPLDITQLDNLDVVLWRCFYRTPIVCSTSSNMGISSHQVLRLMQKARVDFAGRHLPLLNQDEGKLVIWCPDSRADFMNAEKTQLLKNIEVELPPLTTLHTYINRQQRDPGALSEALEAGGYFFPTNPQSKEEIQNLLYVSLTGLAEKNGVTVPELLTKKNVRTALKNLGYDIQDDVVLVTRGVISGLFGLMLPYVIMLEEFLSASHGKAISTWCPASIGAALAGAVLADKILTRPNLIEDDVRSEFNAYFPSLSSFFDTSSVGRDLKTRVHGVFDIANLQSLAQLLGVVVENHMAGRGTAFVGLGSSSYSNGNKCYDILKESVDQGRTFLGKNAFHPATHTINPFAQALILAEDLFRFVRLTNPGENLGPKELEKLTASVKKAEPAGAAAFAGYLLSRLDRHSLSALEIAYVLKLAGFDSKSFLEFAGFGDDENGQTTFLQLAHEEGPSMGGFAENVLTLLNWDASILEEKMKLEKRESRLNYWNTPIDDLEFEYFAGLTCIYLTGDNCVQPRSELMSQLAHSVTANKLKIDQFVHEFIATDDTERKTLSSTIAFRTLSTVNQIGKAMNRKLDRYSKNLMLRLTSKSKRRNG